MVVGLVIVIVLVAVTWALRRRLRPLVIARSGIGELRDEWPMRVAA